VSKSNSKARDLGPRLRAIRKLRKLSQTDLAQRSGLTPAAVSQLESGERSPAFKTLSKLAEALETSVGYLLGEQGAELPPEFRAFFADLEQLGPSDIEKVFDYTAYLRAQSSKRR